METRDRTYLPVLLDVTEKNILLIGAGKACAEKLRTLSQLQKSVTVIARDFSPEFEGKSWLNLKKKDYEVADLTGFDVAYIGVNNRQLENRITEDAKKLGMIVNIVDRVEGSDFISPSSLIKKHFAIFLSTFGRGPGFTKRLRKHIESTLNLDELDQEAGEYILERERKLN